VRGIGERGVVSILSHPHDDGVVVGPGTGGRGNLLVKAERMEPEVDFRQEIGFGRNPSHRVRRLFRQ
jgi:hypothetical protein